MKNDIFNDAWAITHEIISGNVPDPLARGSKWIFAANPLIGSSTNPDLRYPIITIEPYAQGDSSPDSFGINVMNNEIYTTIEVADNVGGSRFDAMCGNLTSGLWSNTGKFALSGLKSPMMRAGDYDNIYFSRDNRLHTKTFVWGLKST